MNKFEEITGIKYSGQSFELTVLVIGSNKNVSLKRGQEYIFDKREKILNEKMYDYYRQFQGLSFIIDHTKNNELENQINNDVSNPTNNKVEEIKLSPKEEKVEMLPSDKEVFEQDREMVKNIIAESEGKNISTITSSTGSSIASSSVSDDELKEILDMSFEENQLHSMLKEIGIDADSSATKSYLINKLVERDRDFVISKINKGI